MPLELITVALITGLAGGLHCLGMCGGLLGALGVGFTPRMSPTLPAGEDREGGGRAASEGNRGGEHRRDPVRAAPRHISEITRVVGYHLGRISTYAILGAICGALGSMALLADGLLPIQQVLYLLSAVLIILLGLWLVGLPSPLLAALERGGARLWGPLRRLARGAMVKRTAGAIYLTGLAWGLVPCAMVYSMLSLALLAGNPRDGALVMAAFGLATVPHLTLGLIAVRHAAPRLKHPAARRLAGSLLIVLAVVGLAHSANLQPALAVLSSWCGG